METRRWIDHVKDITTYCIMKWDWFKNMKKKKGFYEHFFKMNTHSASGFQSIDAAIITKATQISMPHVKWSFRVSSFTDVRSSWLPGQITNRLTTTPGDAGCIIKHGTIIAALHLMVYNQVDLCLIDLQSSHPPGPSRGEAAKANDQKLAVKLVHANRETDRKKKKNTPRTIATQTKRDIIEKRTKKKWPDHLRVDH